MSGDKSGVNRQLSRVGEASADFFCQGDGWACMTDSYQRLGANLFSAVEVTRQKDSSARVQLRTKWANYPEAVCQEYSVDRIEGGWGISYIDVLKKC